MFTLFMSDSVEVFFQILLLFLMFTLNAILTAMVVLKAKEIHNKAFWGMLTLILGAPVAFAYLNFSTLDDTSFRQKLFRKTTAYAAFIAFVTFYLSILVNPLIFQEFLISPLIAVGLPLFVLPLFLFFAAQFSFVAHKDSDILSHDRLFIK